MTGPKLRIFISHPSHFLTDCKPHGDGLLAYQYIERLARRGHELHVAVPVMRVCGALPGNVHVYPVPSVTAVSTSNPSSLNRIEYAIRVRSLLARVQKRAPIDLIHQLNPVVPGMSLFLASSGLPIVLGPMPPHLPPSGGATERRSMAHVLRDLILHRQMTDATLLLIPTSRSLDLIPDTMRSKVRPLHYGVDTALFRPAQTDTATAPSILFLSNLNKRKGILELIDAFERLATQNKDCLLHIAGSGPDEVAVQTRVAQSPFAARMRMLGQIAKKDVPAVLQACTVYCLPSFAEPFGMTALEAMACGKPVVGARSGGLGLLLDDRGSLRVNPADPAELASALLTLLSSADQRREMGRHNRLRVEAEFSWDLVIDKLETLYQEAIALKAGQAGMSSLYRNRSLQEGAS